MNARSINMRAVRPSLPSPSAFASIRVHSRYAFTLIELLAAMTILTVMVLLISRIFADSAGVWQMGSKRVESNTDGRAVVDFMVRELSGALCDGAEGPLGLVLESDKDSVLGMQADRIYFVSSDQMAAVATSTRQVKPIAYMIVQVTNSYEIHRLGDENLAAVRACYSGAYPANKSVAGNRTVLAENVRTLEFWVYDTNGIPHSNFDSSKHGRPGWIEVYCELLGKDGATKASLLASGAAKTYCDRNVRRYVGRAYLHANGGKP